MDWCLPGELREVDRACTSMLLPLYAARRVILGVHDQQWLHVDRFCALPKSGIIYPKRDR